jgi:hypothetical protein
LNVTTPLKAAKTSSHYDAKLEAVGSYDVRLKTTTADGLQKVLVIKSARNLPRKMI